MHNIPGLVLLAYKHMTLYRRSDLSATSADLYYYISRDLMSELFPNLKGSRLVLKAVLKLMVASFHCDAVKNKKQVWILLTLANSLGSPCGERNSPRNAYLLLFLTQNTGLVCCCQR